MFNLAKKIIVWFLFFVCIIPAFASEWNLPGIEIISRSERWADENIRYMDMTYAERKARLNSKTETEMKRLEETDVDEFFEKQKKGWQLEYEKLMRNDYLQTNFSNEQKIDKIIYQNWLNNLSWPQSYHYIKNKIIVHHTAWDSSSFTGKESVISYLKDVYIYHAKKNWRWDIWYNFLIDPYGNIYEWRAGGDSVIWAHTNWNNTPSIGISLMGNFEIQKPTNEQIKSLVNLIATLSKKYNIDPTAKTEYHKVIDEAPYMKSVKAGTIAGHRDAGNTACPGKNLYSMLAQIKKMVLQTMAKWVLVSSSNDIKNTSTPKVTPKTKSNKKGWLNLLKDRIPPYDAFSKAFQKEYFKKNKSKLATASINKISNKINIDEVKQYLNSDISVLLHELSMDFVGWDISCPSTCSFVTPWWLYEANFANIEIAEWWLLLKINGQKHLKSSIKIKANSNEIIEIKNYSRISYLWVSWNSFYGSLTFWRGQIKNLKTNAFENRYIVINTLPFHQYLKWIAETNDSEHIEKIKTMNLISKMYALFYMNPENKHPSIPVWSSYTAIDSPEMFQKYVWAWLEKTLEIVPKLVDQQKNEIVMYDNYVPILPYFNCSAGFTWSAKDKRWWSDTPYLVSRVDIEKCKDFNWHWVGLSWKWAQFFAQNWWTYQEILNYYYPWTQINSL